MNKYDANDILGMMLANELGISTQFLKKIEERCDNESEKAEIYGILYQEDYDIDKAKEALYKKMTPSEKNANDFLNGDIPRLWIFDMDADDTQSYYNSVIDIPRIAPNDPPEPAPEAEHREQKD